ncbi:putative lipid II flippase FtsW [Acidiferrimicrobium sp. IK]|uniref:FtsW/RodA/SpoVE family cell cycle protein n=1 Tax=Acidiferrimicrobium sp. IK TaxID=2871700 RepID=UPI0021CAF93E|nr:putative peptidoglycan glycosyltransferase FtsW [Acidiferrimicrobium sp. IK]MCU4187215.1 putative lipid II flippase FtsW [Acidiferrimicrobium sp. IK]
MKIVFGAEPVGSTTLGVDLSAYPGDALRFSVAITNIGTTETSPGDVLLPASSVIYPMAERRKSPVIRASVPRLSPGEHFVVTGTGVVQAPLVAASTYVGHEVLQVQVGGQLYSQSATISVPLIFSNRFFSRIGDGVIVAIVGLLLLLFSARYLRRPFLLEGLLFVVACLVSWLAGHLAGLLAFATLYGAIGVLIRQRAVSGRWDLLIANSNKTSGEDQEPRGVAPVEQMDDARGVGRRALGSSPRFGSQVTILALLGIIVPFGLLLLFSASSAISQNEYGSPFHFVMRQLVSCGTGMGVLFFFSRVDLQVVRRGSFVLFGLNLLLLLIVLVPGVGVNVSGTIRWIGWSSFSVQPSEFIRLTIVFLAATVLSGEDVRTTRWRDGPEVLVIATILVTCLIMLEPDFGTAAVVCSIIMVVLIGGNVRGTLLWRLAAGAFILFGALAIAAPYRVQRLLSFLHPYRDSSGAGYQAVQAFDAIYRGHLMGVGLQNGLARLGYLPDPFTDFIYAVTAEQLGAIGACLIVVLFFLLALTGIRVAYRAGSEYQRLLALGSTAIVVVGAYLNIGANIGFFPITGIPLPLISFGGSENVASFAALGVLLNVARRNERQRRCSAAL